MLQYIIQNARGMAGYIETMVKDIPDADIASPAGAIVNHPAWQIGHLIGAFAYAAGMLGKPFQPPAWTNLCGGGKLPDNTRSNYPSKEQMLQDFKTAHEASIQAFSEASTETLETTTPNEQFRAMFPTIGSAAVCLIENHVANHAGQLAMWRREKGFKYLW